MIIIKITSLFFFFMFIGPNMAQEINNEYITFNDRRNMVHGFYAGSIANFTKVHNKNALGTGLKIAYVANHKFEIGLAGNFLFSESNSLNSITNSSEDLIALYGGLHLEPILSSKTRFNLSFPILIGPGLVGYLDTTNSARLEDEDMVSFFVVEPGINLLFNFSSFFQVETGIKYRFSSRYKLENHSRQTINGFSLGIGVKLGVFNLGKNRYKQQLM